MDRLILGDNQFFGVNHMSEGKGMDRLQRFQDTGEIIKVLDAAYDAGIHAFTFSTHDRVKQLCDHFRANKTRYADLRLYPALPYAHKYAEAVNEKGILGAVKDMLMTDNSAGQMLSMIARGTMAMVNRDPVQTGQLLIDTELKMFHGLNVQAVFLQNIVTDLLLGIGVPAPFQVFSEYIEKKYKARAGFITLNMPRCVDFLLQAGIKDPLVCSAINKAGFQMNPGVAEYEKALAEKEFTPMAMSVMAAGAVPPQEAFEYVARLPRLRSVMFGASSIGNIRNTAETFNRLWGERNSTER